MPSIRKTKKRLKKDIAEDERLLRILEGVKFPTFKQCHLYSAICNDTERLKQELHNLKRKKQ